MGCSLSWVAVLGKSTESVYEQLDLQGTGTREEMPDSPIVGANLPGGWTLVMEGRDERLVNDTILQPLSVGCEVVACFVEEHVMVSSASGWKDGHKIWSVLHDSQQGIEHLDVKGDLPPLFDSICDRLRSEQQADGGKNAVVDYIFSIPEELAFALTGFHHEMDIADAGDSPFEVLISTVSKPEEKTWGSDSLFEALNSTMPKAEKKSWIMRFLGR